MNLIFGQQMLVLTLYDLGKTCLLHPHTIMAVVPLKARSTNGREHGERTRIELSSGTVVIVTEKVGEIMAQLALTPPPAGKRSE